MSFFKKGGSEGAITENDLPLSVKAKLEQIAEIKEIVENLDPSVGGGDIDLGTF